MWTRGIGIGVVAAAVALAQPPGRGGAQDWGLRLVGAEPGRPGLVVKGAPFSADITTEITQNLPGNRIHEVSTSRFYRDSEGRTRREQSLGGLGALAAGANLPPVVFINDPVARANYALNPSAHTATKSSGNRGFGWMGGPAQAPQRQDAPGPGGRRMREGQVGNTKTESLGRQTIESVPADGTRLTVTIPAGAVGNEQPIQIVTETWYSPDLQLVILSKRTDPRSGETVTRYTNISRTEPARSLFEVPPDFKVTDVPGRGARGITK